MRKLIYNYKIEKILNENKVKINKLYIQKGQKIQKNDKIANLEYLDGSKDIKSPFNGIIHQIYLKEGDIINIDYKFYDLIIDKSYLLSRDVSFTIIKIFITWAILSFLGLFLLQKSKDENNLHQLKIKELIENQKNKINN